MIKEERRGRHLQYEPPDPVELRASGTAQKEVDAEQVPVLGDDDQRVAGPDQTCSSMTRVK